MDSVLKRTIQVAEKLAICKKGRLEGGGGRDPVRGGKNLSWMNFASHTTNILYCWSSHIN